HPHEPLDHLGLRRLHAAVPPDRAVADRHVQLPDGHLPLRAGVLLPRLRPRRRDLDPHAAHGRAAQRRLRAQDGPVRRGAMSAQTQIAPAPVAPTVGRTRRTRRRRATRAAWNLVGIVVLVILAFPVYWMVSTAFKSDD